MIDLLAIVDRYGHLPKPKGWVPMPAVVGQINGLPGFRGTCVATNGIHVAIETSSGEIVVGHRDWFIKDPTERTSRPAKVQPTIDFDELFV